MLILTDGAKPNVFLSGRNLPTVHVMPYSDVSTYHILWSDVVLIEAGALGHTLAPIAEEREAVRTKKSAAKNAAGQEAGGEEGRRAEGREGAGEEDAAKKAAKKAAKAPAAKKAAAKKPAAKSAKKKGK